MECASKQFEPGWLDRTCRDASLRVMMNNSPAFVTAARITEAKPPIPDDEARDLFEMMDARFKSWTGKSLRDFCAAEPKA